MSPPLRLLETLAARALVTAGVAVVTAAAALAAAAAALADSTEYYAIEVVDDASGRGVPLVELRTTGRRAFYTDSAGLAAIDDPTLMGRRVFFHVSSHGYSYPKDGFGFAGVALDVEAGGRTRIAIHRENIAERLYRVTGAGIYEDSVRLGQNAPIREPLLNGGVVGQDSVLALPWGDRVFWFFGDTARLDYPLGLFHTSGATSLLPSAGGLAPGTGVDLTYFVGEDGFSRAMCPLEGAGAVWLDGLALVKAAAGAERMVAHYSRVRGLEAILEHGVCVWSEEAERFEKHTEFDLARMWECPRGHPLPYRDGETDYLLFATPFTQVRVPATLEAVTNQDAYEAYTCLRPGARYDGAESPLARDAEGRPVWAFRSGTEPVTQQQERELIEAGAIRPEDAIYDAREKGTDRAVRLHAGSVAWNAYLRKWIMIAVESFGESSFVGEIWFAVADSPMGPWRRAVKIVTHDHYDFYNPLHHPFLDENGGRIIYFQGTHTRMFEGEAPPTPRYEYNQIMYRLDLADERLR